MDNPVCAAVHVYHYSDRPAAIMRSYVGNVQKVLFTSAGFLISIGTILFLFVWIQRSQHDAAYMEFSRLCARKKTETLQQFLGGITILHALRQNGKFQGVPSIADFNGIANDLLSQSDWNITALTQLKYFADTTQLDAYEVTGNITRRPLTAGDGLDVNEILLNVNSYPNSSSIGMDYFTDSSRFNLVREARETRDLTISKPLRTSASPTSKVVIFFLPNYNENGVFIGGFSGAYRQEVVIVDNGDDRSLSYQVLLDGNTFFTNADFEESAFIASFPFNLNKHRFDFSCGTGYSPTLTPIMILLLGMVLSLVIPVSVVYSSSQIQKIKKETSSRIALEKEMSIAKVNEQTALQSAALKAAFLANVSHEIRTPLNGITGMTEFLLETNLTREQLNYVGVIKKSGGMLMSLVNDVLDFSKAESQKIIKEDLVCDVLAILHEIPIIFADMTNENNNLVEVQHELPELWCVTDPGRLQQILANLFSNATKFTKNGVIVIKVVKESPKLVFSVSDTGIGMTDSHMKNLFTPFTQADESITRKYGGTGLGLAICKKLVELLGGEIWAVSEVGIGTTMYFSIPFFGCEKPTHVAACTINQNDDFKLFSKDKYILVVDDNKINLKVAEKMLKNLGFFTVTANDGMEAVEVFKNLPLDNSRYYSAILMDIQMPNLDGLDATRMIRQGGHSIPIVAMTANVLSGEREKCLAAGMNEYLTKPLNQKDMGTVLRQVIMNTNGDSSETLNI